MSSLAVLHSRVGAGLDLRRQDPLSYWHIAVPRLREAFSLMEKDVDELAGRACNKGTKTESFAAYVIACAQKRTNLDGVPLPRWRGPVECAQLVLDYPQQILSVQPAYLRLLGRWPYRATWSGEILKTLKVKTIYGSDRESEWSTIHFLSQQNRRSGVGVRGDVVAFDEPPSMAILRELRKAAHAGRRGIRLIGFTPTIRRQYQELKADYGDTPRRSIRRVDQERAEVRWSLDEVADWVLSPEEKAKLLRIYEKDPLKQARIHGDYCITEGTCPFNANGLKELLEACEEPKRIVNWRVTQTAENDTGRTKVVRTVPVEVWKEPELNKSYWVTIDPSSGVDDNMHDPFELCVTEDETGDLCLRAGGYLTGRLVGTLAAGIARQYNNSRVDVEVNDRWGVNVVEGVHAAGYGNWARERRELKDGSFSDEIGFHNNQNTRPLIIGAVQSWVDNWAAGIKYAKCPSRAYIETLMDCVLDEKGKIVGAPGVHDERLIVRGQALRRAVRRMGIDMPEFATPKPTKNQALVERMRAQARREEWEEDTGGAMVAADRPDA